MAPTTTRPAHIEVLVAVDLDGVDRLDDLLARLGDAVVEAETVDYTTRRAGTVPEHRIQFDAGHLRNTEAAGIAFHLGYVASVQPMPAPAQHQPCGCVYVPQGYGGTFTTVCAAHPERR